VAVAEIVPLPAPDGPSIAMISLRMIAGLQDGVFLKFQ